MIDANNVDQLVTTAFANIRNEVESGVRPLASEHTLRLLFTWELGRLLNYDPSYTFDLEWQAFGDIDGKDTFLDLLVWTDPEFKLAVEFKLPKRSPTGSNSPITNTRAKMCRDVSRLSHLVRNDINGIKLGYFLAAVNEPSYLIEGRKKVNAHYRVFHGATYEAGVVLEAGKGSNAVHRPLPFPDHPIVFRWDGFRPIGARADITGRFAWLEPIRVG